MEHIPDRVQLNELLELYFEYCNGLIPFLHRPTFSANEAGTLVLIAMAAIGALYLSTPDGMELSLALSRKIHRILIFAYSPAVSINANCCGLLFPH
jgi:uncharacterized membrane protein